MSRAGILCALWLCFGCAASGQAPVRTEPAAPAFLLPIGEIEGDFSIRQQLGYEYGDRRGSFETVVQKYCDELVVVGLTPIGARAFTIRQRGLDPEATWHLPGSWPLPPGYILADIHRVLLLPPIEAVAPQAANESEAASESPAANESPAASEADAVREALQGSELVREQWAAGRLLERSFHRRGEPERVQARVRYPGGVAPGEAVREAELVSPAYGYRLHVLTLEHQTLVCLD